MGLLGWSALARAIGDRVAEADAAYARGYVDGYACARAHARTERAPAPAREADDEPRVTRARAPRDV